MVIWAPKIGAPAPSSRAPIAGDQIAALPAALHNVQFVKYDVTVSFMAQVLDTVAYLVSQVLDTASSSNCLVRFY